MSENFFININEQTLFKVLNKMLNTDIINADYQATTLHGGTLGDVRLVTGTAITGPGEKLPFSVVLKIQKKWERYADPGSWRREYDLYKSDLGEYFTENFRWPDCYHAEINEAEDEIQLWLQYIDGISGLNLTKEMYENAAYELGRFQGRLYCEKPNLLQKLTNLSDTGYMKKFYHHYRSWPVVYDYIRADNCEIPPHLCQMLINVDENSAEIFNLVEKLPVVFCHRDFWVTNIIYANEKFYLIDWDTTGWGYLGEDIASLIADEADVTSMVEYYYCCVPTYYKGFSEYAGISHFARNYVLEMVLLLFGYRLIEWYLNAGSAAEKNLQLETLQKIYEMGKTALALSHLEDEND
ncbi:MAG: aminoglycoside phosphotransferase family protein [Lachnospiraceae bacterium]|nr:aminoglycoside phosphotransferase family protein [Lachnospiraceae bacterium]